MSESQYGAFVGWDWADREHQICLRDATTGQVEQTTISGTPESLHEWASTIRQRYPGKKIAICIESSRGAVVWAFMSYDHLVLYPVNPKSAASFREAFYPSGKKDDPVDGEVLSLMVEKHHDKLRPLQPADPATREMGILSEYRRKLVQELVRMTNQLGSTLKTYFPQALELAGDLDTVLACDLLERFPTLESVKRVREKTLREFYTKRRCRSAERIAERLALVRLAVPLTEDPAVTASGMIKSRTLVRVIRSLLEAIAEVEAKLAQLYQQHPEHDLVDSFPGAGAVFGARIISIVGSDRSRFESADELQRFTGIAPVTKRSGGPKGSISVHRRLRRSKFLHQTIVEWAGHAAIHSEWARAYYTKQKAAGKSHFVILRALGYKLVRILFHCWKNSIHYNEQVHQESLVRRGSPLASLLKVA